MTETPGPWGNRRGDQSDRNTRPVFPHPHLQLGKPRHRRAKACAPYCSADRGPSRDLSLYVRVPAADSSPVLPAGHTAGAQPLRAQCVAQPAAPVSPAPCVTLHCTRVHLFNPPDGFARCGLTSPPAAGGETGPEELLTCRVRTAGEQQSWGLKPELCGSQRGLQTAEPVLAGGAPPRKRECT